MKHLQILLHNLTYPTCLTIFPCTREITSTKVVEDVIESSNEIADGNQTEEETHESKESKDTFGRI